MLTYKKSQGFTLLELMVTIAIMAIMAAIALPSMRNFVASTRVVNRSEQIANAFRFAKGEAARMNVPVLICGTTIRSDGRPSNVCKANQISNGLLVYADKNQDGQYTASIDEALRTVAINDTKVSDNNKVAVKVDGCLVTGNACNLNITSNEFVFMPNSMFGYKNDNSKATSYAALKANTTLGTAYIRILVSDPKRDNGATRFVVVSPGGSTTVCNAAKNSQEAESGEFKRICQLAVK